MIVSRRSFLKILVAMAGTVAIGYFAVERVNPVRALYHRVITTRLEDSPAGAMKTQTLQTLIAVTETLTDSTIEISHYASFFRWRSENLRGYKNIYEKFSAFLDHYAENKIGCNFVKCDDSQRYRILEDIRPNGSGDKFRKGIINKDLLHFENYIIRDVLHLFARTDAWIALGYESWQGIPRGLTDYIRKIGSVALKK